MSASKRENNTSTTRQENSMSTNRHSQKLKGEIGDLNFILQVDEESQMDRIHKEISPRSLMRNTT